MKRARRVVRLAVLALVGGAVVSVLVAEGIGVSGAVHYSMRSPVQLFTYGGGYVQARDTGGIGWRFVWSYVLDKETATMLQPPPGKHGQGFEVQTGPAAMPGWSRLQQSASWAGYTEHQQVMEVGAGWPMMSFAMDWDSGHLHEWHGGALVRDEVDGSQRVLLWRPIPLGLAADTLFYAVGVAGLAGGARLFVRGRRLRRGACSACGYDRRGLAAGAACPECGRGP